MREVFRTWLPLAASWAVMGMGYRSLARHARQVDPAVHLAACGGVVLVALIVEAPVIMLLAASVALARDTASHQLIYRIMMVPCAALTVARTSPSRPCSTWYYRCSRPRRRWWSRRGSLKIMLPGRGPSVTAASTRVRSSGSAARTT